MVLHDTNGIIRCAKTIYTTFQVLIEISHFCLINISKVNFHMLISVWSALLMPVTYDMSNLMSNSSEGEATIGK